MRKGVAVLIGQVAFGCGANVGEDEGGRCFAGETSQVDAVPGGYY